MDSYFQSSTVWGPCPEREKIILVTMARSVTTSSRKEVIADVAGLFSLNLRGRNAGIVPVDGCLGHTTLISIIGNANGLHGSQDSFLFGT